MSSAVITYCGHFFHGNCLRKWLYVQETCPMCHQTVRPTSTGPEASGDAPAAPTRRDEGPDPAAQQEGDPNRDNGSSQETQGDAVTPDPAEQREETERFEDGAREDEDEPETHEDAVQGLRFSSSGDFVGFVSPCSSGDNSTSHKTSPPNPHGEGEEVVEDSPLPSALSEFTVERQSDSNGAELEDGRTVCPTNCDVSKRDGCEGTPGSRDSYEASGVESRDINSELSDCVDNPQSGKETVSRTDSEDRD